VVTIATGTRNHRLWAPPRGVTSAAQLTEEGRELAGPLPSDWSFCLYTLRIQQICGLLNA